MSVSIISLIIIISYIALGVTDYGRVTLPGTEDGAWVYRYKDGIGLLPDPNVLSYGLCFLFLISIAYSGFRWVVFLLFFSALLLVGSRSALISFSIAFLYCIYIRTSSAKKYILIFFLLIPAGIGVAYFIFPKIFERFTNPENYIERSVTWMSLFENYISGGLNVFFGYGFASARSDFGDPHNFYLSVLYDGGLLAFICLFFVYFSAFKYVAAVFEVNSKAVANSILIFNIFIGFFYWQDQMFFLPFLLIWLLSMNKKFNNNLREKY